MFVSHRFHLRPAMCLAIPMRIESIEGYTAHCQAKGIWREVSLFLLQDNVPAVGDFVMVQVGYALNTVSEAEAMASWALYDQILAELEAPSSDRV